MAYKNNPAVQVNGVGLASAPHIVNLGFLVHAQQTVARLDLAGFAIAAGPACSAYSLEPSKTLMAMGCTKEQSSESVRISLGLSSNKSHMQDLGNLFES